MHIITIYKIYINIFLSRQVKVDGRVNRNGTDSKNITESGMSFSQNLGFQLLHNLDFLCSESKIASLTRLTFARPEGERAQYLFNLPPTLTSSIRLDYGWKTSL